MQDLVSTKEVENRHRRSNIRSPNAKLHDSSVHIVRLRGYRLSHLQARCRHSKTLFSKKSYGSAWRSHCRVENTNSEQKIDS